VKKETLKRRKYDKEFKEEVLRMISTGRPVSEVAQSLGIGENLIYKWKSRSQPKAPITALAPLQADSNLRQENERLKAEMRRLEQERDILKKALSIFSRET